MKHIKLTGTSSNRHRRNVGNTILAWVFVVLIVVVVCVVGVKIFLNMGRNSLKNKAISTAPVIAQEPTSGEEANVSIPVDDEIWKETWVSYDGKIYEYNEDMLVFLMLGIDKMEKVSKSKDKVSGGQSDAIFLVCMNQKTKDIKLIGVNRDTMVDVVMVGIGENGEDIIAPAEIAVQHGFGDGMEQSCELTRDAVSKLFYELPIHGYLSFNMGGIAELTKALGGVTVNVLEDLTGVNPTWLKGTEITLKGKDAYDYIHYRDITVFESARGRLARQKQYLSIVSKNVFAKTKEDITFPVKLFNKFKPYIVTDLTMDEVSWLATQMPDYSFNTDDIYTMEGTTQMGEQFEEFYPDKEALKRLMFEIFYNEIDPEDYK